MDRKIISVRYTFLMHLILKKRASLKKKCYENISELSFEKNNPGIDQIINIKMYNKTHIWCPDKDIIIVGRMLCKYLIGHAFLHPILSAKVFSAFGQNMSGSSESVDQTLLNAFSFEIAIISASGKNVELSC